MMRGLEELMQRQQQLLDRSFRAQRRRDQQSRQPGQPAGEDQDNAGQMGEMGDAAGQQEALRRSSAR